MVKIDKKSFIKGLSNPNEISENNYKSFLKLSKDYPFFNSVHLINLFISKKFNSIEYEKNLKNFSLKFLDRKYLYNTLNNDDFFTKKQVTEIVNDLKHLFSNSEIENIKSNHYLDKTGKSKVDETIFWIDTGETIRIGCYDWSEEFDYGDKLTVAILSKEITKFFIDRPWQIKAHSH